MKNTGKRLLAAVLAVVMLLSLSLVAFAAQNDDDEFKVVVSVEGLTIGQGLYFEPKAYTISEINELVASEGYGPYEQSELTAGIATLAFFIDHGIEYTMTGDWDSTAYISSVKDIDKARLISPRSSPKTAARQMTKTTATTTSISASLTTAQCPAGW